MERIGQDSAIDWSFDLSLTWGWGLQAAEEYECVTIYRFGFALFWRAKPLPSSWLESFSMSVRLRTERGQSMGEGVRLEGSRSFHDLF